jgi:hypothetical protein
MNRRKFLAGSATAVTAYAASSICGTSIFAAPKPTLTLQSGEDRTIWYDKYHLIVQANGDGADTAQREGMYWFARGMYRRGADFHNIHPWITLRPGENNQTDSQQLYRSIVHQFLARDAAGKLIGFRRHPRQPGDNSNPSKMSRDQLLPLIAAMSAWDDWETLREIYDFFSKQPGPFSFLNSDWMDLFRQYIRRARNEAVDETLDHLILDAAVEARLCCIRDANDVGDDLNLLVILTLSEMPRQKKDYIAAIRKKFAENRPMNYGSYLGAYYQNYDRKTNLDPKVMIDRIEKGIKAGWQPNCSGALGAIRWYCRSEAGGNPGLARMLRPIVQQYLGASMPPAGAMFTAYKCAAPDAIKKGFCQKN